MKLSIYFVTIVTLGLLGGCVTTETPKTPASPTTGELISAWSQIGPDGQWIARVIISGEKCPAVTVDGAQAPMSTRAPATTTHPVTACDANIPATGKNIAVMVGLLLSDEVLI